MAVDAPPTPPAAEPAPAAQVAPAPAGGTFYVDAPEYRYAVTGNTLLPQARIEAILKAAERAPALISGEALRGSEFSRRLWLLRRAFGC